MESNQIPNEVQRKVRVAERNIEIPFIAAGGTQEGYEWLLQNIDPNHDIEFKTIQDWPDNFNGRVVVRRIQQAIEVKKPVALPAGNWDCHVVRWPNMSGASSSFCVTTSRNNNSVSVAAIPQPVTSPIGGLQAYCVPSGTEINIMQTSGTVIGGQIDIDPALMTGECRVVADCFEVHNTTAMLQKQGSVCTWRQNSYQKELSNYCMTFPEGAGGQRTALFSAQNVRYPPSSLKEALYFSGSRQWEAQDGCYCVGAFNTEFNPMVASTNQSMVVLASDQEGKEGFEIAQLNVPVPYQPAPVGTITPQAAVRTVRVHPIDTYGAIFTGLSDQTALTINLTTHIAVAPAQGDIAIIQLTRASNPYDPVALEIASKYNQVRLSGCRAGENGFGDFMFDASRKIAKFLGPVVSAIPHPLAQGAGAAMKYYYENTKQSSGGKKKKPKAKPISQEAALAILEGKAGGKGSLKKDKREVKKREKKLDKALSKREIDILMKDPRMQKAIASALTG